MNFYFFHTKDQPRFEWHFSHGKFNQLRKHIDFHLYNGLPSDDKWTWWWFLYVCFHIANVDLSNFFHGLDGWQTNWNGIFKKKRKLLNKTWKSQQFLPFRFLFFSRRTNLECKHCGWYLSIELVWISCDGSEIDSNDTAVLTRFTKIDRLQICNDIVQFIFNGMSLKKFNQLFLALNIKICHLH